MLPMNFIGKYVLDLRSKFTTQRAAKVFSFTNNIRGRFNGLRAANADSSVRDIS